MNLFRRIFKHLISGPWAVRRAFPSTARERIKQEIAASERRHRGELVLYIEGELGLLDLLRGTSARARAQEVFAARRVWDTEENNGVLLYLLLADRNMEILADRGLTKLVPAAKWEEICRGMEASFANGEFLTGLLQGISAIGNVLEEHYPPGPQNANELPDKPVIA